MLLYKKGARIFIKPKKRGIFKAKAINAGKTVQEYASAVLANRKTILQL